MQLQAFNSKALDSIKPITNNPTRPTQGGTNMALTKTFRQMLDKTVMLWAIALKGETRAALRIARVVSLALVGSLCSPSMAAAPAVERPYRAEEIAKQYVNDKSQFRCLYKLYSKESNWNYKAVNKSVTPHAYGIPQLRNEIIANKSAELQIIYGLKYIANRYGVIEPYSTPNACKAYAHFKRYNWH